MGLERDSDAQREDVSIRPSSRICDFQSRIAKMFRWIWQILFNLVWGDQIGPVLQALTDCGVACSVISELNEKDLRKLYKGGYRTTPLL